MADNNLPYFIMGIGVGAALGILFAPKPGKEAREDIQRRADESREYVRRRGGELRERAGEVIDQGREIVDSQREQLNSALEAGRKAYHDVSSGKSDDDSEAQAAAT